MLTEAQKKAVYLLRSGQQVQEVAAALGVHRCTIWRWECKKDFGREWKRLEREDRKTRRQRFRQSERYISRQKEKQTARRKLRRLEKQMHEAAASGNLKLMERAYEEYKNQLFKAY